MKKFYAIMAAALAATCVASAQLPSISLNKADLVPVSGFHAVEDLAPMADSYNSVTSTIVGQSSRKAPARAQAGDPFTNFQFGDYVVTFEDEETPFTTRFVTTKIEQGEKEGEAIVKNFFYSDAMDMAATMSYNDITFSDGTYTLPELLIAPGTPFIEDEDGTVYGIYLCSPSKGAVYTQNEIEWIIDEESGEIWLPYNNTIEIGYFTKKDDGFWGAFIAPSVNLYKKNAEMTAMFYYYDSQTQTSGFEEATCPVWTYAYEGQYVDANQQPTGETFIGVNAIGWGGCGKVFRFLIEDLGEEQYVAAAYDQVGAVYDGDDFYYCDLAYEDGEPTFQWVVEGEEKLWMVATVGVDGDGNTVFAQDGEWCLFNDQVGILTSWQEGITVFDYNIGVGGDEPDEPDGVEAIDSNDNAPAEYYNLQGVKVANPTPGQLYIVKQGSKVSKVIR